MPKNNYSYFSEYLLTLKTVEWKNDSVVMIDQTKLPNILEYVTYTDFNQVADAIRTLVIRGAPAIGVSGAFGLALAALQSDAKEKDELIKAQNEVIGVLFEIIKRFQTNNDLTDEYLKLSIKEKIESDNERLEAITKERDEHANIIARLLEKLET